MPVLTFTSSLNPLNLIPRHPAQQSCLLVRRDRGRAESSRLQGVELQLRSLQLLLTTSRPFLCPMRCCSRYPARPLAASSSSEEFGLISLQIAAYLGALDLFNFSRASKSLFVLLRAERGGIQKLWETALKNTQGFPTCPPNMSEPALVNLLCYGECKTPVSVNICHPF